MDRIKVQISIPLFIMQKIEFKMQLIYLYEKYQYKYYYKNLNKNKKNVIINNIYLKKTKFLSKYKI